MMVILSREETIEFFKQRPKEYRAVLYTSPLPVRDGANL